MIGRNKDSTPNGILTAIFCCHSYSTANFLKNTTQWQHPDNRSPWMSFHQTAAGFWATPRTQVCCLFSAVTAEDPGRLLCTLTQTHLNPEDTIWSSNSRIHIPLCAAACASGVRCIAVCICYEASSLV